jgi:hypothetical protein
VLQSGRILAVSRETNAKGEQMKLPAEAKNLTDEQGNPAGGSYKTTGIEINWQNGPLGQGADRKEPNGAFVENVIEAAIQRLEFYQASKFKCRDNAIALTQLETALLWLGKRTKDREARGVEGTHEA